MHGPHLVVCTDNLVDGCTWLLTSYVHNPAPPRDRLMIEPIVALWGAHNWLGVAPPAYNVWPARTARPVTAGPTTACARQRLKTSRSAL